MRRQFDRCRENGPAAAGWIGLSSDAGSRRAHDGALPNPIFFLFDLPVVPQVVPLSHLTFEELVAARKLLDRARDQAPPLNFIRRAG